ncbi:hypothetical protein M0812_28048 [Anaeramoeba flamelloides]|uniref:Cadherin domain-containing protein n=1 Tax=Anaeramoeba flamelloides TaxID=1746091 RepID=A0AAV7Y738_9EUKA|nr:hypothetical protein M0812_28048 [Anaeramoeba flamelloides]
MKLKLFVLFSFLLIFSSYVNSYAFKNMEASDNAFSSNTVDEIEGDVCVLDDGKQVYVFRETTTNKIQYTVQNVDGTESTAASDIFSAQTYSKPKVVCSGSAFVIGAIDVTNLEIVLEYCSTEACSDAVTGSVAPTTTTEVLDFDMAVTANTLLVAYFYTNTYNFIGEQELAFNDFTNKIPDNIVCTGDGTAICYRPSIATDGVQVVIAYSFDDGTNGVLNFIKKTNVNSGMFGTEFQVSTEVVTLKDIVVICLASDKAVVAFTDNSGDIQAQKINIFDSTPALDGLLTQLNIDSANKNEPKLILTTDDNFVASWVDNGDVEFRHFDNTLTAIDWCATEDLTVSVTTAGTESSLNIDFNAVAGYLAFVYHTDSTTVYSIGGGQVADVYKKIDPPVWTDASTVTEIIKKPTVLTDYEYTGSVASDVKSSLTYSATGTNTFIVFSNDDTMKIDFDTTSGDCDCATEAAPVNYPITITVEDEFGQTVSTTDNFKFQLQNTKPTTDGTIADQSIAGKDDTTWSFVPTGKFIESDSGQTLKYSYEIAGSTETWLVLNEDSGEFTATDTPKTGCDDETYTVDVFASDGCESSDANSFTLTVENVAPNLVSAIPDKEVNNKGTDSWDISSYFADDNADDTLSYTFTYDGSATSPTWLELNSGTGVFDKTADITNIQDDTTTVNIVVTAADGCSNSVDDTFILTLKNQGPDYNNDGASSYDVYRKTTGTITTTQTFTDPEDDTITYSFLKADDSALPSWLSVESQELKWDLTNEECNFDETPMQIQKIATDAHGNTNSVKAEFAIEILDNRSPTSADDLVDQEINNTGDTLSYDTSTTFSDDDSTIGDTLAYSYTIDAAAPVSWLKLDAATGVFTVDSDITTKNDDTKDRAIVVTATDDCSQTATASFTLKTINEAPVYNNDGASSYDVYRKTTGTITTTQTFTDPEDDTITYSFLKADDSAFYQVGYQSKVKNSNGI